MIKLYLNSGLGFMRAAIVYSALCTIYKDIFPLSTKKIVKEMYFIE